MTRRLLAAVLAAAVFVVPAIVTAVAAPRAEAAPSFVDKQVIAGGLLIQSYLNLYGQKNQFVFPPASKVKKSGGLPDPSKLKIWPANPWTGKVMGPGTKRGTYTYKLASDKRSYTLTMHLSKGSKKLTGSMPQWLKTERDTASKQNLWLLQRYVEKYKIDEGAYPATLDAGTFSGYSWPVNPWTGAPMAPADAKTKLGDFRYVLTGGGTGYTLEVALTGGWSTPKLQPLLLTRLIAASGI